VGNMNQSKAEVKPEMKSLYETTTKIWAQILHFFHSCNCVFEVSKCRCQQNTLSDSKEKNLESKKKNSYAPTERTQLSRLFSRPTPQRQQNLDSQSCTDGSCLDKKWIPKIQSHSDAKNAIIRVFARFPRRRGNNKKEVTATFKLNYSKHGFKEWDHWTYIQTSQIKNLR
jgi:hypothetical protein